MPLFPDRLPKIFLDLIGAGSCPAVPLVGSLDLIDTLIRLAGREDEIEAAKKGLTNQYTIGGTTAMAIQFLFGPGLRTGAFDDLRMLLQADPFSVLKLLTAHERSALGVDAPPAPPALTGRPLESAAQWSIAWTNYAGVYERAAPPFGTALGGFTAALDPAHPRAASEAFWPTIAEHGLGFNLLVLEKVRGGLLDELTGLFGGAWAPGWAAAAADGRLYAIDLRVMDGLPPDVGNQRFTPGTVTLLVQDLSPSGPPTKALTAVAVRVSGLAATGAQVYVESSPAWLYGLQAARTSVTVFGIWLGHVYHWHIVTAATLYSMRRSLPGPGEAASGSPAHPVRLLLDPQSEFLFEFDVVLLLLWADIAPPTSVATHWEFLRLMSRYAAGRTFFMDDPVATLERNGITAADFTHCDAWDRYPIVGTLLAVWDATAEYVGAFVNATYGPGNPPSADPALQTWAQQTADPDVGNVPGFPTAIDTAEDLKRLLTSLVYRVTMHGAARLLSTANPGLTFVANFPPCLQSPSVPPPDTPLTPVKLFEYLPRTGTIGGMVKFYYTFSFSRPYVPFVPEYGVASDLPFPGGPADPGNQALIAYRLAIQGLIDRLSPVSPPTQSQRYQWPRSIET